MKRRKRVRRSGRIDSLKASESGDRSTLFAELRRLRERREALQRWREVPKKKVTLKLDVDVLIWFREQGREYQWEVNRALRKVMEEELRASSRELESC